MQTHHIIPVSRGGTDDVWNLIDLSDEAHARQHAIDFVLFPSAPMFHFGMTGWRLLDPELQAAVKAEMKNRDTGRHKLHREKLPDGRSKAGVKNVQKMHKEKTKDGRSKNAYLAKSEYRIPIIAEKDDECLLFESIHTAAIELKLHATLICKVLKKKRNHTGGYRFYYANRLPNDASHRGNVQPWLG